MLTDLHNLKQNIIQSSSSTTLPLKLSCQLKKEVEKNNDNNDSDFSKEKTNNEETDFSNSDSQSVTGENSNVTDRDKVTHDIISATEQILQPDQLYGKDWPDEPVKLLIYRFFLSNYFRITIIKDY